jgi:broad specificity phosphatase PhoE
MSLIYWVRHGENWANITRELSTRRVDYSLTPRGVLQAEQTAAFFRAKAVDAVFSSPLKRALETAAPIAAALGLPVQVVEEFRELNVGALEDKLPDRAAWNLHDDLLHAWLDDRGRGTAFPAGEDYPTMLNRLVKGLRLAARCERAVVVAHGGLLYAALPGLVDGMDPAWTRENDRNPNCAVTEFEPVEGDGRLRLVLKAWAQHAHLSGDAAVKITGVPKRSGHKRPAVMYLCVPRAAAQDRLDQLAQEHPGWWTLNSWPADGLAEEEMRRRVGSAQKWGMASLFMRVEQALRACTEGQGAIIAGPGSPGDMRRAAELFSLSEWEAILDKKIADPEF